MIAVRIEVDALPFTRVLSALERGQLRFAESLAINNLTKLAQSNIQAHYDTAFDLRQADFIRKQGAKILKFATKSDPVSELGIDPKADFLAKFQLGGSRPKSGQFIAIPNLVRRNKRDIVGRTNRPRALIDRLGKRKGAGGVFVDRDEAGRHPGIYQRTGRGGRGTPKLLYAFEDRAQIPASLQFIQIATQTAQRDWARLFEDALVQALRTAR